MTLLHVPEIGTTCADWKFAVEMGALAVSCLAFLGCFLCWLGIRRSRARQIASLERFTREHAPGSGP